MSSSDSSQNFIRRNRVPRVHIAYDDPYEADKKIELPFVMAVMADLSGDCSEVAKPDMADRKFLDIDMDNFEQRMAAIEPATAFRVKDRLGESGDQLSVKLTFSKMDDFSPAAVARQVPALAKLLEAREQLANLTRYMDGKSAAEARLRELLQDKELLTALGRKFADQASDEGGEA